MTNGRRRARVQAAGQVPVRRRGHPVPARQRGDRADGAGGALRARRRPLRAPARPRWPTTAPRRARRCSTRWPRRPTTSGWRWPPWARPSRCSTTTTPSAWRRSSSGPSRWPTGARGGPTASSPGATACPTRSFASASAGQPSQGVKGFIDGAVTAAVRADRTLAQLQDSMRPVEVGDAELRAGLSEVRRLVADVPRRANELVRAWAVVVRGVAAPGAPRRRWCPDSPARVRSPGLPDGSRSAPTPAGDHHADVVTCEPCAATSARCTTSSLPPRTKRCMTPPCSSSARSAASPSPPRPTRRRSSARSRRSRRATTRLLDDARDERAAQGPRGRGGQAPRPSAERYAA